MDKKETSKEPNVMYVRLSKHYIQYLKTKYGDPVLLPIMSPLNLCIERYLVNNPTMKELTTFSYSELAMNPTAWHDDISYVCIPKLTYKERLEYVAVVIPDELIRPGRIIKTSNSWQLSAVGAKMFRKQVKRDFWICLSNFNDDCRYRSQRMNFSLTFEDVVSDFITLYNIEMENFDNIIRSWRRIRYDIKNEVENHRDYIENKTNRSFFYTV